MTNRVLSGLLAAAVVALPSISLFAQGQPQKGAAPAPPAAEPKPITAVGEAADKEEIAPVPVADKTIANWREAIALASAEDPNYSISILEVERSRGVERQTLAGTLPSLEATGVLTFNLLRQDVDSVDFTTGQAVTTTIPASPTALAQLSLRQPLIAPRVWYAIGTAERQTELARTSTKDNRRVLVAAVADAIVTVVTAERAAEVNRVGHKASLDRLKLQKKRRELGAGSDLDVIRFRQDVVAARGTVIQGDESLRQARERLGLALGSPVQYGVTPEISINEVESTLGRICEKGTIENRADILALRQQREISERAVTDADLRYAPTADLLSTFSYSSEEIIGESHASWNIQGVLTVPIWDGGEKYGARRSALAVVKQADERIDFAMRSAKTEITQADRGVIVANENLAIATASRDLAKETDRLVQRSFQDGGEVTSFDLVDAARRLREAELTLTVRELDLVRAKISSMLANADCKSE